MDAEDGAPDACVGDRSPFRLAGPLPRSSGRCPEGGAPSNTDVTFLRITKRYMTVRWCTNMSI